MKQYLYDWDLSSYAGTCDYFGNTQGCNGEVLTDQSCLTAITCTTCDQTMYMAPLTMNTPILFTESLEIHLQWSVLLASLVVEPLHVLI